VAKNRRNASIDGTLMPALFSPQEWAELVECCGLSCRQAEIVGLLIQGWPCCEIVEALGISESTFRTQLDRAKVRLAARDSDELIYQLLWKFRLFVEPKRHLWAPRDTA
jgi:DNA-binding NarL/FixJ family response regulator